MNTIYTLKVQYMNRPRCIAASSNTFNGALAAYRALKNKGALVYARITTPGVNDYIIA